MCQKFQKQLFTVGGGSKRFEGTFSPKRQGERVSTPLHAMPLGLFCKSAEETIIHLFSECFCSQYMWNQTQIFLLGNL